MKILAFLLLTLSPTWSAPITEKEDLELPTKGIYNHTENEDGVHNHIEDEYGVYDYTEDEDGVHNHSDQFRDGRGANLRNNLFKLGDISVSGNVEGSKVSIGSRVDIQLGADHQHSSKPGSFDECKLKTCGELCETGVCDGDGFCVDPLMNPCEQHGCGGKSCGDHCLSGDIVGNCDIDGECDFDSDRAINSCDKQEAPKQEGESCGSCFCPPTYSAGDCAEGLTCQRDERLPDAPGICTRPAADKIRYGGIQANFDFRTLTPDDIKAATQLIIQDAKAVYDAVGALSRDNINYQTAIKPLIDVERDFHTKGKPLELSSMVAVDKGVRDASSESVKDQDEFNVEMSMRKDVLDNIVAFSETEEAKSLEGEYKRFVEKFIIDGKRNGLHLSEEKRDEIKELKKRISKLENEFQKNLNEDTTHLFFDVKDLGGIPEDLLNSFERDSDGKCKVTMKYPHYFPVIRKCNNAKTRQRVETAFYSRCIKENTAIIEEIVELRQKQAEMLGYENHAAYIQELNMAKNPKAVAKFLEELAVKLQPLWEEEKKIMLNLKEKESKEVGVEFTNKLDFWDFEYYMTMVEEKLYAVDQEKLKEYFPIEVVTSGLMNIYQKILGLNFAKVEDAEVWNDEVDLYRVDDLASGETLGFFYLDLYPREGKFGGARMMQLQPGCNDKMGNRQKSVVVMITNFSKPSKDKPSLLNHEEVKIYFHEFGHVMHGICSKAGTQRFFGPEVERDFVEAPSQMLENWVWEEEPLRLMSKHYKDDTPLPKEMLNKLVASKRANAGAFNLGRIALATFDQRLHTAPKDTKIDSAALFTKIYKEIIGIETIPETNIAAILPYLVGGYDARLYGYFWSEVFAQDMFQSRFAKEGVMNSSTGMDYRNLILAPGGSIDAMDMLKHFLKRRPTPDAFLKSKGIHYNL